MLSCWRLPCIHRSLRTSLSSPCLVFLTLPVLTSVHQPLGCLYTAVPIWYSSCSALPSTQYNPTLGPPYLVCPTCGTNGSLTSPFMSSSRERSNSWVRSCSNGFRSTCFRSYIAAVVGSPHFIRHPTRLPPSSLVRLPFLPVSFPVPNASFRAAIAPAPVTQPVCPLQISWTTNHAPHHFATGDYPSCSRFFYLHLPLPLLRRPYVVSSIPRFINLRIPHPICVQNPSRLLVAWPAST